MAVIGALKIALQAETAQFFRSLRRTRGDLHKTGQAGVASGAALGALTAALGGIAVAAGRASMALNRGMANVATLIPGNTERVAALKTAVQDLAAAHGKSSQDLAAGLYQTISAFGDAAGRTMRILRINSEAAAAGVATTEDAFALTSAVTKAYGDTSAEAVRHAADLALTTVRLGQTDFTPAGVVDRQDDAAGRETGRDAGGARGELRHAHRRHRLHRRGEHAGSRRS